MLPISPDWMTQTVTVWMLISVRLLGCFLSMPLFAFRAAPMRLRVLLALVTAFALLPMVQSELPPMASLAPGYAMVLVEMAVGLTSGWMVRIGLSAVDMMADVLSQQSGLSFAATLQHDANLASGLVGEFLGLVALALAFTMNIHLVMLSLLVQSFKVVPLGTWPAAWDWTAVLGLMQDAFSLGLVLALPAIVIYFLFNMTQAILARVSPQMNLFSVGFAIMIPVAFLVVVLLLPSFADLVQRALESPFELLKSGLATAPAPSPARN
jgi:flagellar biosynthetic protein FliR